VTPTWRSERLPEVVRALAGRPRHEALRGHVTELLRSGFGAAYEEIGQEVYLLDGSGRIDTMWGAWLEPLLSDRPDILPEPRVVTQVFGRHSMTFGKARIALEALWATFNAAVCTYASATNRNEPPARSTRPSPGHGWW